MWRKAFNIFKKNLLAPCMNWLFLCLSSRSSKSIKRFQFLPYFSNYFASVFTSYWRMFAFWFTKKYICIPLYHFCKFFCRKNHTPCIQNGQITMIPNAQKHGKNLAIQSYQQQSRTPILGRWWTQKRLSFQSYTNLI